MTTKTKERVTVQTGAALIMLLGAGGVMALVLAMNSLTPPPAEPPAGKRPAFVVPVKPKPAPTRKRKPKPKRHRTNRTSGLKPSLLASIAGPSFGIPTLDAADTLGTGARAQDTSNMIMTEDAVDVAPKPTRQSPPEYPARARARGVTGSVVLNLLISAGGDVESVKVLESSPHGVFDDSAVRTVKSWRFAPGLYKGEPVRSWWRYVVRFSLT